MAFQIKWLSEQRKMAISLVITVDNGITAFDASNYGAKELGIDVIITDHHRPHDHVPDAYAIVNPQSK